MKLNKCFTDTFNSTMKQAGFSKTGLLYYRMNGTMLQGVWLKTCNPFHICFATLPYWMYKAQLYPDIKKGWWTQEGGFMEGFYYNPQTPEQNQAQMESVLNFFVHTILVYLDGMKTEQDYFLNRLKGNFDFNAPQACDTQYWNGVYSSLNADILLHQKHLGDLPQPIEVYLDKYIEELLPKRLLFAKTDEEIAVQTQKVQKLKEFYISKLHEVSKEQFLERYDNMCADMKEKIKEQLKLSSFE